MTPFERGFIKAGVVAGLSEKQARETHNLAHQNFMAQGDKRVFSPAETQQVEQAKRKLLPKFFSSYKDPIHSQMYSPAIPSALLGLLGVGAGALAGSALSNGDGIGTGLGALAGGGLGGAIGYFNRKSNNEDLEEQMSRLPENATLRDYYADPLYQHEQSVARESRRPNLSIPLPFRGGSSAFVHV